MILKKFFGLSLTYLCSRWHHSDNCWPRGRVGRRLTRGRQDHRGGCRGRSSVHVGKVTDAVIAGILIVWSGAGVNNVTSFTDSGGPTLLHLPHNLRMLHAIWGGRGHGGRGHPLLTLQFIGGWKIVVVKTYLCLKKKKKKKTLIIWLIKHQFRIVLKIILQF